jgi:DNA helicase-4
MTPSNKDIILHGLNARQREAVLSNDRRVLVLAGAGSGKTKTLLQKIIYLIREKGVKPSSILAITFTKNAANEMLDRLILSADQSGTYQRIMEDKGISKPAKDQKRLEFAAKYKWIHNLTIRTFHSLSYSILRNYGAAEFDNKFRVLGDKKQTEVGTKQNLAPETPFEVMHKILIEMCNNPEYMLMLKRYILDYFVDRNFEEKFHRMARQTEGRRYTTLRGEKVRSKSERDIADWMYRHNIAYSYEPQVRIVEFDFKPDFHIPQANLYLEHVSNMSKGLPRKEQQFEMGGKTLVKTFEPMTQDSTLFNRALDRIVKGRISEGYDHAFSLSFEEEFRALHDYIRDFIRQVLRIMDMIKLEGKSYTDICRKAQKDQHERVRNLYKLAHPLLKKFDEYCVNRSYLDFNDMILRTLSLLENRREIHDKFRSTYQYILVDEFQDVNNLQVRLVKKLLSRKAQLFCVGDDWQSIYGFRGSEVSYIINFQRYFKNARVIKLQLNYRSVTNIVGASNEVISHNKFRVDKKIRARKKSASKINIYASTDIDDAVDYVVNECHKLINLGYSKEEVLILYRRSKMYAPYYQRLRAEGISVTGRTIHGSKGLEARAVFIIGLTEGYGGFPDIWLDDRIFQVVRHVPHHLMMEEERRLFYVALTRAMDKLHLITEKGNESSFIDEIPSRYTISYQQRAKPMTMELRKCPSCKQYLEDEFKYCPYCGWNED